MKVTEAETYCGAEMGEVREGECECPRCTPTPEVVLGAEERITEAERDELCDAVMGYQHTATTSAPTRMDKYVVPAVERIIAARLAAERAAHEGLRARVEALRENWRSLPVWGPDDRGLMILDYVDHEGLMRDIDAALEKEEDE